MARDFIPVVFNTTGPITARAAGWVGGHTSQENLHNCVPIIMPDGIGATPRRQIDNSGAFVPDNAADRGRGVYSFAGKTVYLDQDTYYYSGGSQDLTATTGNGYAANTGFNEEYIASFTSHKISNVDNLVIVNAGHTSTHASANHGNIWYVADGVSAPSSVSDGDLICNDATTPVSIIRGGASLNGYFFVGDIYGTIYNSDLNSITAWTAGNSLTAEREADIGMYVGRHHDNIVYFGTKSIEFFYDAGNASGSPLARRQDLAYRIGCQFPNSICEVGDVIYFAGIDQNGEQGIYKLESFQVTKISTPRINQMFASNWVAPLLTSLDPFDNQVWIARLYIEEGPGIIFTDGISNSFYWHEQTGTWSRWEFGANPTYMGGLSSWTNVFPVVFSHYRSIQFANGVYGNRASTDNDAIDDLGETNAPDVFMLFEPWDAGTDKKKRINNIRVITYPRATTDGANVNLDIGVRWIDLDETIASNLPPDNFSTARTVDLNKRGARLYRLGTTRMRQFLLDWTIGHGTPSIIKGLEIDYDIVE